jgi:subtilisin-like proprotein convertase family protein
MAHTLRSPRQLARLVAMLLAATTLGPAPHAVAFTDSFPTLTPTYLGDLFVGNSSAGIAVPGTGDVGPAAPYPSQVNVPHTHPATVLDVNVVIEGLTSTHPGDLNVLLVGPGGQQALVMSDVGGASDISNMTFILDDEGGFTLGDGPITNVPYQPQNQGVDSDFFPAPAPALTGNSALSVFDGTIPGGVWSLYVVDDQTGDSHSIFRWSLRLTLATTPYPSTVQVGGLPPVSDVNVKLQGLKAGMLADVHLLLVGPGGQQSYLMGDAGSGAAIADVNVTVDDEAGVPFPASGAITSGSYRPARYGLRTFPAPAPVASGNTVLSVFDGLDPDGEWRLYALDDATGLFSSLDSWSLEFTWEDTTGPTGTVSINGGAASTGSRDVTVNLSATDPHDATGVAAVRLSNDGVTFSPYQPYAASLAWTLPEGDGDKKVYAQFRDGAGNDSAIVSDSITLSQITPSQDTTGPRAAKLTPRQNAADVKPTVKVKVKATEALRKGSVSKRTVFLKEKGAAGKVPAKVTYRAAGRTLVITPRSPMDRHTPYVVTVKRVKDLAGNVWDQKPKKSGAQPLKYPFKTG